MKILNMKYFRNENGPQNPDVFKENFEKLYSDSIYSAVIHLLASKASLKSESPVYQYLYTHTGSLSMAEISHLSFWQVLTKVSEIFFRF